MERALEALEIPPAFRGFPGKGHGLGLIPTRLHLVVVSLYSNWRTAIAQEKQDGTQAISSVGRLCPTIQEAAGHS